MFTEDKIKELIQKNNINESCVKYIVSFDSFGDVEVELEDNSIVSDLRNKIVELEDEIVDLEDRIIGLDDRVEELEELLDERS